MLDRIVRQMLRWMVFATLALFGAGAAYAGTPTLTFTQGWIGEYTSSINGPNVMYAFDGGTPDLNIQSVTISQNSTTNLFQTQGNDIPVTITVNFVNGTRVTGLGGVNWRETAGSTLRGIGLRLDQAISDGYPLTSGKSKTYLLKIPNSTLAIANGGSINGNAAMTGLLDALNAQLGATPNFTMSKTAAASVNQGASLAYTIGLGNSGGGTSGTSVTVQDVLPTGVSYVSAAGVTGVSSVSCTQSGQTLTCTATLSSGLAAYSANGTASFRINTTAPSSGTSITNYASVDPNGTAFPPAASGCTSSMCANATTTLTGTGVISGHFTRNGGTAISGTTVNLLNSSDTVLASATTDSSGAYTFTGLVTGTYGVRFMSNGSIKGKAKTSHGSANGEYIRGITLNVGTSISDADAVQIDPAGVIYNSVTRQPVSGAVVTFLFNGSLVSNSWLDQTLGGANTQTTGADGRYSFVLNATAQTGTYTIAVSGPSGYTFQSQAIPASSGPYDPGLGGGIVAIQSQSTAPTGADATTYYLDFSLAVGTNSATTSNGVINNHIPIDPTPVVTIANTANGAEPATNGRMTVTLSTASATSTVISYTVGGTATSGSDYTALSGSITIAAGQTSGTITIPVLDDSLIEGGETVVVTLSSITSGTATLSTTPANLTATNTITDNDGNNAPVFSSTNALDASSAPAYSFDYAENSASGATVGTVVATDADGNTLTYSIASGNGSGWYAINSSTGVITLTSTGAASLANNYEAAPNTQTLTVSVSDGTVSTTIEVKLNETNVNDNAPAFTSTNATDATSAPSYAFTYPENSASGATLGTVVATDADGNTLTFSITGGNANSWYAIDPSTGVITLTAAGSTSLANDYEATPNTQTLTVSVSDGSNTTPIEVKLSETNVNDSAPTFTGQNAGSGTSYSFDYAENSTTSTTLGTVAASDADGGTLTFSITGGNANSWYTINSSTGVITLTTAGAASAANDFETTPNSQTLTVSVSDGSNTTTVQVVLNETNVNDGSPVFTGQNAGGGTSYAFSYAENSTTSTTLGTVAASDPDGNTLTFSITGGNANSWYTINSSTGVITLTTAGAASAANDYEATPNSQTLTVSVSDGSNTTTVQVALNETNLNDSTPTFTGQNAGGGTSYSFNYAENSATSTTLGTVAASDADGGTLTFSITGGNTDGWYTINSSTGVITLTTAGAASAANDYETAPNTQTLTVTVSDGTNSTTVQVVLNETNANDGAPVFTGQNAGGGTSYSFNYAENSAASTLLGTVAASDPDGGTLTFGIASGNANGWYAIDPSTGAITLTTAGAASIANDYEQTPNTQTLIVSVSDGTTTTTVSVALNETNVNDSTPTFTGQNAGSGTSYSFDYAENSATSVVLGTVAASDADGGTLTFSITGGNTNSWYAINSSTGAITLTTAGAASLANDFEQTPNAQTLTVTVSDGTNTTTVQVALNETNVNDGAPVFTGQNAGSGASYSFDYAENSATSVVLGTVAASDPDGGTLTFSITGGNTNGWYAINASTGAITLTTAGAASLANDFEQTPNAQTLTVSVSDGTNTTTVQVALNETNANDGAPVFTGQNAGSGTSYSFNYAENSAANAVLGTVAANDPDGGTLTFSITGGNTNGWYAINASTGAITLTTAGAASLANDFEQTPNAQTLTISVSDGTNTTTVQVALNETNVNDGSPVFTSTNATDANSAPSYGFSYAENSASGSTLGTVSASDPDGNTLTFSITGGNANGWYAINASTGAITLTAAGATSLANDYEQTPNSQTLTVSVSDGTNTTPIEVKLSETDVADSAPPAITGPSGGSGAAASGISVNEGQTGVTRLTANTAVTWTITGGNEAGKFRVAADGTISFVAAPDFENPTDSDTNNTYILTVTATDAAGNASAQTVTVTVLNIDDTAALITGPSGGAGAAASALAINEGLTAVTTFIANERVTWAIDGGSDASRFRIDASTGAIVFLWAPDFEFPTDSDSNNTYVVRVKATDVAGNVSYQTLTVTVLNVDEIARKMAQIGGRLSADLRGHATHGLSDMLSFNETLMRSNDDVCSDPKAHKPLSGSAQANQAGGAIRLNYSDRLSQCGRAAQLFFDAGLTYSKLGAGWNSRVFAGLRYETRVGDNLALGAGLLASRASDKLGSFAQSAISDKSLQFNVYARYRLSKVLRTGAFAGLGTTWYDFALTDTDSFTAAGQMRGKRQVFGWMMSGDINVGDTVITTDAVVSRATEKLGTATLAAKYLGESRSGIALAVGSVDVTRISIPVTAPIMLSGSARDLGASTRLVLGPGLLCEDSSADSSSLRCGYQLAAKLMASDGARSRIYADYHWESVAGMERSLIGLGYGYRFGKDDGLELALELDRGLTGQSGQDNRALLSLRLAH